MKVCRILVIVMMLFSGMAIGQARLLATFYDGTEFDKKVGVSYVDQINMAWDNTAPMVGMDPHNCSIRWTGLITSPETGTYQFSAKVDDGLRLWVGGVQVIDQWKLNDHAKYTGYVKMEAGKQYNIKVEYFNALLEGEIRLQWKLPDANEAEIIAPAYFSQKLKPVKKVRPSTTQPIQPPLEEAPKVVTNEPKKPLVQPVKISRDTIERYTPRNVNFEQGTNVLLSGGLAELDALAKFLLRNSGVNLTIEGHTDVIGDQKMNLTLSQERADKVAQYLTSKGVAAKDLTAIGYGSKKPLVTGNKKTGYPENRRVVFKLEME